MYFNRMGKQIKKYKRFFFKIFKFYGINKITLLKNILVSLSVIAAVKRLIK